MIGDIKHIVVIESLKDESLTGKELYNDCIRRRVDLYNKPITHKYHFVENKAQFIELLKYFEVNGRFFRDGLLIHLEMHGSKEGGLALIDDSLINWEELVLLLRPINIATCNKLYLTMATCYGRFLYLGIDPYLKAPYSGYISASMEVSGGEILENFFALFEYLIEVGNLIAAYQETEEGIEKFYYKDLETSFEDAFQMEVTRLNEDKGYKEEFVQGCIEEAKAKGGDIPDEIQIEEMFEMALGRIYNRQKAAFNFSC
ncbi:hypothetical protein [Owenweeksia hongkongensis]|uniref:hypothetical protein n=1 Tax=Owenweeksia hongkongensis TaxID=253245 RepID=UPI003A931F80